VLLKLFQRLGRPVPLSEVPWAIVEHVGRSLGIPAAALDSEAYDRSATRRRHLVVIRALLGVQPYGPAARHAMIHPLAEAASTKHELEDLINIAIEQLVRQRFIVSPPNAHICLALGRSNAMTHGATTDNSCRAASAPGLDGRNGLRYARASSADSVGRG